MKKVSIIIPVYNTAQYIRDCLESACEQTLDEIEIIIINDGSTDNSEKIIQEFCRKDKRITYIKQENQGVSAARNQGIDIAQGEYIFFFDSDDIMAGNFIEELYKSAKTNVSDIVFTDRRNIGNLTDKEVSVVITHGCFYRTEFLKKHPEIRFPVGIPLGEDGLFSHTALSKTEKISRSFNSWYYYRYNRKQATHKLTPKTKINASEKGLAYLEKFYDENNLWDTRALHLVRYIQYEIFYASFYYMPRRNFIARRKLFYMISRFFKVYIRPHLTDEEFETLGYHFKRMLKSKSFMEFEIKDLLLSNPVIHKIFMKYKKRNKH